MLSLQVLYLTPASVCLHPGSGCGLLSVSIGTHLLKSLVPGAPPSLLHDLIHAPGPLLLARLVSEAPLLGERSPLCLRSLRRTNQSHLPLETIVLLMFLQTCVNAVFCIQENDPLWSQTLVALLSWLRGCSPEAAAQPVPTTSPCLV